jgi:DGQHR domain-containing protein
MTTPRISRRTEKKSHEKKTWEYPALELKQGESKKVYCFAVNGKDVHHFAAISRIAQSSEGKIIGYQRPEIQQHIKEIKEYIDSSEAMIPNAVVLSFDSGFEFIPDSKGSSFGRVRIDIPNDGTKPGFIVDGQQRLGAIRDCNRESFEIFATAFKTVDVDEQREQFVLVNNVKPLQKSLIYELIPDIKGKMPARLQQKKIPSHLTMCLDGDTGSPFYGLIKRPTNPTGFITDTVVQRMIEYSIRDGALRYCANLEQFDFEMALTILKKYWIDVKEVFPEAWAKNPRISRLSHGVGIISLGSIMDLIHQQGQELRTKEILRGISEHCAWVEGKSWDINGEIVLFNRPQNISKDIRMISHHLQSLAYKQIVHQTESA